MPINAIISTELKRVRSLSIGLADYGNSIYVDYPIAGNIKMEYVYFMFRYLINLIIIENKNFTYSNKILKNKKKNAKKTKIK